MVRSDFVILMESFICDYCGAEPGRRCTSKTGRRLSNSHSDRYYKAFNQRAQQDRAWLGLSTLSKI